MATAADPPRAFLSPLTGRVTKSIDILCSFTPWASFEYYEKLTKLKKISDLSCSLPAKTMEEVACRASNLQWLHWPTLETPAFSTLSSTPWDSPQDFSTVSIIWSTTWAFIPQQPPLMVNEKFIWLANKARLACFARVPARPRYVRMDWAMSWVLHWLNSSVPHLEHDPKPPILHKSSSHSIIN